MEKDPPLRLARSAVKAEAGVKLTEAETKTFAQD
jgi:hypothetical protein